MHSTHIPDELWRIKENLDQGGRPSSTVRKLLSWFNVERRGANVVGQIAAALRHVGLRTAPNFEEAWIDATIGFFLLEARQEARTDERGAALQEPARIEVRAEHGDVRPSGEDSRSERQAAAAASATSSAEVTRLVSEIIAATELTRVTAPSEARVTGETSDEAPGPPTGEAQAHAPALSESAPDPSISTAEDAAEAFTDNTPSAEQTQSFHRIGALDAAHQKPLFIKPDATVKEAVTLMLRHGYSQLPVMDRLTYTGVHGVVSWETIGKATALGKPLVTVRECMEALKMVTEDENLFDVARTVAEQGFVLVTKHRGEVMGFVTASDLTEQLGELLEPFLLIGDIESMLRSLIDERLAPDIVRAARAPQMRGKEVESAAELTMGEYQKLLERDENWEALKVPLDRSIFISGLDAVRATRNDVMHFIPEGVSAKDLQQLRSFASFLRTITRACLTSKVVETRKKGSDAGKKGPFSARKPAEAPKNGPR